MVITILCADILKATECEGPGNCAAVRVHVPLLVLELWDGIKVHFMLIIITTTVYNLVNL